MKAVAVLPESRTLQLLDHPDPSIEHPDQALLAMLDVGVDCHDFRPVTIDQLCAHFNAQDERLAQVRR